MALTALKRRTELLERKIQQRTQDSVEIHTDIPDTWEEFAKLTTIRTSGKVSKFHPYPFQVELVNSIHTHPNTIIAKSRQLGISETLCSYLLWRVLREPGFSAAVFSKTQNDSSELGKRIRLMANSLGELCPPFLTESNTAISFQGRGGIHFLPATSSASRGLPSVSVLIFDEAAYIPNIDALYQSAAPTLSMLGDRGRIIMNSTPNGRSGFYWDLWDGADDDWNRVTLHYSQHPIYSADPQWAEKTKTKRKLTDLQWRVEYEIDFAASDSELFSRELIERATQGERQDGLVGRNYWIGVDPNFSGNDCFAAIVMDMTTPPYKVVGWYYEAGRTTEYSLHQVAELIDGYNPSLVSVEANGGGIIVMEALQKKYLGIPFEPVLTTQPRKIANTDRIRLMLERNHLLFPQDCPLVEELKRFRQSDDGKKREAAPGYRDDMVMALAHCLATYHENETKTSSYWWDLI